MAKVSDLVLKPQSGADTTAYASWTFGGKTTSSTGKAGTKPKVGDWVNVKSGARWYNGASIASFVFSSGPWKVVSVSGDRVVINQNKAGTHSIMSPIAASNLTGGTGTGSSSSGSALSESTVDCYAVKWWYDTGNGVWFLGADNSSVKTKSSTYKVPDNALRIRVGVKPISKKHKVNKKETSYWSGSWVYKNYTVSNFPPETPRVPDVTIEGLKLTARIENVDDPRSDQIQFQVVNGTKLVKSGTVKVTTARASYSCTVTAGGDYRVRARAVNLISSGKNYSDWSDYSDPEPAAPAAPGSITSCRATSSTSIRVEWEASKTAVTYEMEYAPELRYFDGSNEVKTVSGIESNTYEVTGLETGRTWFFRVRSVNSQGESPWTEAASAAAGEDPSAPTTWSDSVTAIVGDAAVLRWAPNHPDGSAQTYAEVEVSIDGTAETYTVRGDASSYVVDTSELSEGAAIEWRVRTAGVTLSFGPWSVVRRIDVYAVPTLDVSLTDADGEDVTVVTAFPFFLGALAGPRTQEPTGYHVEVVAGESYTATDQMGREERVGAGDAVYSRYVDTSDALLIEFGPQNIDLEPGVPYEARVTASMDSGLTAEGSVELTAEWEDAAAEPDLEVAVDESSWTAQLKPYVMDEAGEYLEGFWLSVYRREFDGTFTEIATGVDSADGTAVTDPHPALDYARYRVVSISKDTGAVAFYDPPAYPVGCRSVVIQWDETWSDFDAVEDELAVQPWEGSLVELPYNISVSDSGDRDVEAVAYAGRRFPVSYYGTQEGSTSSWSVEFPKIDADTLYALRRLKAWMGDAYVREPSGTGYWASVEVSLDQSYDTMAVTASFDITRVEGGA